MPLKKPLSKKIKGGENIDNILIHENINVSDYTICINNLENKDPTITHNVDTDITNLYYKILKILDRGAANNDENVSKIKNLLQKLFEIEPYNFFNDIADIVKSYNPNNKISNNFSTTKYSTDTLFGKYKLSVVEDKRTFITIDPTIIQLMVFDDISDSNDSVYSLKLIMRETNILTLRYTTKIFSNTQDNKANSQISVFNNLGKFIVFNEELNKPFFKDFNFKLNDFLDTYIKFYKFYAKCYTTPDSKEFKDYQLKYISILGKARFKNTDIINRTAVLSDYIMANLLFVSPAYAFISGGYKGFKENAYGITRSGYEIAKKYNRPILTIMCKEGMHDAHEYSDATLIYGEHWGEDTIALSQFTDGAIIIAPFGGWTYVECLALLQQKKIVGIYNDLYNILNYEEKKENENLKKEALSLYGGIITDDDLTNNTIKRIIDNDIEQLTKLNQNKNDNINFFNFATSEQKSIIDYYINYYLILFKICNLSQKPEFITCLEYGIKILVHLKILFTAGKICLIDNGIHSDEFKSLLDAFNNIKTNINNYVNDKLENINRIYKSYINITETYQDYIPKNCDGIWIKPAFDLIEDCIEVNADGKKNADLMLQHFEIYKEAGILKEEAMKAKKAAEEAQKKVTEAISIEQTIKVKNTELRDAKLKADEAKLKADEAKLKADEAKLTISGGKKKCAKRTGGNCREKVETILNKLNYYKINSEVLMHHNIFTKLNNNIIFVFSDVMYLNDYLNTNLNKINVEKKINDIYYKYLHNRHSNSKSKSSFKLLTDNSTKSTNESIDELMDEFEKIISSKSSNPRDTPSFNSVNLNRNIDGMLDINKGIIHSHLIREKYSFIINEICNTAIFTDKPKTTKTLRPPTGE